MPRYIFSTAPNGVAYNWIVWDLLEGREVGHYYTRKEALRACNYFNELNGGKLYCR